jgi:outer membrane protein OmpA-like peptidoglycan-associated protein
MQRKIALAAAMLTFGLFCFFCLRLHSGEIQQDVSNRVSTVLAANHIPTQGVSVSGRDVTLSGPAGSREVSTDTQKLAAGIEGVRTVAVRIVEAMPDARTMGAKTESQRKLDALLSLGVVEFNPASAQLTPRGRSVLDQVAPLLAASPALLCEIQGHTDSQGNPAANQTLSLRRATATKTYLVAKGIAPERLLPKGFGDTQPVASNATAAGRQRNRRINFLLKENP